MGNPGMVWLLERNHGSCIFVYMNGVDEMTGVATPILELWSVMLPLPCQIVVSIDSLLQTI
jgi:hypothetical protein